MDVTPIFKNNNQNEIATQFSFLAFPIYNVKRATRFFMKRSIDSSSNFGKTRIELIATRLELIISRHRSMRAPI